MSLTLALNERVQSILTHASAHTKFIFVARVRVSSARCGASKIRIAKVAYDL